MKEVLEDWIRKAEGDFNTASREIKITERVNYDIVCILCQQCVEKYLKAFQIYTIDDFSWGHSLVELLESCIRVDNSFEFVRFECSELNGFMRLRYPADFAQKDDAQRALRYTKVVRKFIREKLGLTKQKSTKKKK